MVLLLLLRELFLLTAAHVLGFCIAVPLLAVYVFIFEGQLLNSEDLLLVFGIYLFSYIVFLIPTLFSGQLIASRPSVFNKMVLLLYGITMVFISVMFMFTKSEDQSFLDLFLIIGAFTLLALSLVLGVVIANRLMHAITAVVHATTAGLSQSKRKLVARVKPPKILDFAGYGKRVVIGQDQAIEAIQKVLIANTKLADRGDLRRQRILASFLFVGPTGVGKTETAKAIASWLRQDGYDFLRIDANQFSDRESTWTLLGSPKGYIGSETPGLLPYAVSQNPKQVILIDEIEKADQGFYQFLLQMLDEGYVVERSTGYAYELNRAIVIITSNLENERIAEIMEKLSDPIQIDISVRKTLEGARINFGGGRTFRITPEFLGRIDAVVPFRSLGFEDLVKLAYWELRGLGENVSMDFARAMTQKYYPIAREYGVRYFLKKLQEDVLSQ